MAKMVTFMCFLPPFKFFKLFKKIRTPIEQPGEKKVSPLEKWIKTDKQFTEEGFLKIF